MHSFVPPRSGAADRKPADRPRRAVIGARPAPLHFSGGAGARREAPAAPSTAAGGLPQGLQSVMEAMSGFSLADVVVHRNSAEPSRLGAVAFTRGSQIHLSPGQERHLPHEAWHVVQQKQGRVRPTLQMQGGHRISDEPGLEAEADLIGARTARLSIAQLAGFAPPTLPTTPLYDVHQLVIRGLESMTAPEHIPADWVQRFVDDLTESEVHLYHEDLVAWLDANEAGWADAATLKLESDHWDVTLGQGEQAVHVTTLADGSCGVYALRAIRNRANINASVAQYGAPPDFVAQVRSWVQQRMRADEAEVRQRILTQIRERDNLLLTGFGPRLQDAINTHILRSQTTTTTEQESSQGSSGGPSKGKTISNNEDSNTSPQVSMGIPTKDAPSLQSSTPSFTWAGFKKSFKISGASRFLQQLGPAKTLEPKSKWPSAGKIGYVANILTIPGKSVQNIISAYELASSEQSYGSFAMVIGVNRYRSLDGETVAKVLDAAQTAKEAKFPCAVIPFLWDFNWGSPFNEVQNKYRQMSDKDRAEALAEEKKNLVQSVIPYGQLRERVTADPATELFVAALAETHSHVYIHLGDDDAVMLPKGLLDLYTETIGRQGNPSPLVVGGYRFATKETGGDLNKDLPADQLTALASEIDILFRSLLTTVNTELVYPTEPNLAFLVASKTSKGVSFHNLLAPSKQEEKQQVASKKTALETEKASFEKGADSYYSTGLLYGHKTNEGARLRERLKEVRKLQPSATKFTLYDPGLAITTTSARFTLRDEDRVQHEASAAHYRVKRHAAFEKKDEKAFRMQVMEDLLSIKQSHIGGLGKEIDTCGDKDDKKARQAIATDVFNAAVALLSGQELPKQLQSNRSARYIKLLEDKRFQTLAEQVQAIVTKMWKSMEKPNEGKDQSSETDKGTSASTSEGLTPKQSQILSPAKQTQLDAPSSQSVPSRYSQIETLVAWGLAELEKVRERWQEKESKTAKDTPPGYSQRIASVRSIRMAPEDDPFETLQLMVKDIIVNQSHAAGL